MIAAFKNEVYFYFADSLKKFCSSYCYFVQENINTGFDMAFIAITLLLFAGVAAGLLLKPRPPFMHRPMSGVSAAWSGIAAVAILTHSAELFAISILLALAGTVLGAAVVIRPKEPANRSAGAVMSVASVLAFLLTIMLMVHATAPDKSQMTSAELEKYEAAAELRRTQRELEKALSEGADVARVEIAGSQATVWIEIDSAWDNKSYVEKLSFNIADAAMQLKGKQELTALVPKTRYILMVKSMDGGYFRALSVDYDTNTFAQLQDGHTRHHDREILDKAQQVSSDHASGREILTDWCKSLENGEAGTIFCAKWLGII
ncbi:MAG: hypothetical protein P1U67_00895 [Alcanivoracaceae bacterium]|nr:hypothetical protein [Alcanivoracaceae bacterium]